MITNRSLPVLASAAIAVVGCVPAAVVPTRPAEELPAAGSWVSFTQAR